MAPRNQTAAQRSISAEATGNTRGRGAADHLSEAPPWTFLTNHAHVLIVLHSEPDTVLREVASRVGITERAVQRIVQDLEDEGYISRERIGRRNHYQITSSKQLRHPIESHCTINQVLQLVNSSAASAKQRT